MEIGVIPASLKGGVTSEGNCGSTGEADWKGRNFGRSGSAAAFQHFCSKQIFLIFFLIVNEPPTQISYILS